MFGRRKKAPEVVGIHVGRNTLTIIRVVRNAGEPEVVELFSESLPRDPSGWPVERVGDTLRKAKKVMNLKAEEAKITVSSDLAPSDFLVVPPMRGEQLENACKLQLESKWADTGSSLCYQFQVLDKRGERCRVFAPSIPTERLRLILASFLEVNCCIDSMEVEGVSLANLMLYCGLAGTTPLGALQVSPNWGEIYIVSRRRLALSRPVTKLETDVGKLENDAADSVPVDLSAEDGTVTLSSGYLGRIAREANTTLDYFEIELLSPAVDSLVLFGDAAEVAGLPGFLAQELELEVSLLDTGEKIQDSTGQYEPTLHGLAVAAAIGGAKSDAD